MPLPASADGSLGPGGPSMNSRGAAAGGGAGIQNMQNIQGGIGAVSIGDREAAMLAQQSQYDNIGHHLHHHGAGRDPHGPPAPSTPQGFHRTLSQPQGGPSPSLSAKSKLSQVRFLSKSDDPLKEPDHLGHRSGSFWQISGVFRFFQRVPPLKS